MDCEVVVVGGGIGGLTVAALLAQRGVNVCLLEREQQVGGCAAPFEKFGYSFDPTYGLFTGWEPGGIHEQVFSELAVDAPEQRECESAYSVRLPDASEIKLTRDQAHFETQLRENFAECSDHAIDFYRETTRVGFALRRALRKMPDLLARSATPRAFSLFSRNPLQAEFRRYQDQSAASQLKQTSIRFQRFVDLQLQTFTQGNSDEVPYLQAALALSAPLDGMYRLSGGGAALAARLAQSITKSGGRVRLNTPVLRLAYDSSGAAVGVDLLSGETVRAAKAIVSNLTIWDTYGKLVGLNRTPTEIRKQINALRGWGAYLLYLGLEDAVAVPDHVLALTDWQTSAPYNPEQNQFMFAPGPASDGNAPAGKRAVTVHTFTNVDEWFTFHRDEAEHDEKDQQMLEACWNRLHAVMPELGSRIEVIETATPRTFYDLTRRKLGMVGGIIPSLQEPLAADASRTSLPNLFLLSDTSSGWGFEAVTRAAWLLVGKLSS
jgi:phytoene dehydrogenase-like protein